MNRRAVSFVALAAIVSAATPLFAKEVSVGPWIVLSGTTGDGATFCTMRQSGDETTMSLQVISNGQVFLSAANPGWKFTPQTSMPAKYAIDGNATWEGNAFAPLPTMIIIGLPGDPDPADALAAGKSLVASVEGGAATFDLAGAAEARETLKTCVAKKGDF